MPTIGDRVFCAPGSRVIGRVEIGKQSSIWFNTVIRGDVHHIRIGARTNIQDNTTVHVTEGVAPCLIGDDVTIGHNAIVHACTLEDLCLVGIGAIVLDKAVIKTGSFVAAGAVVPPGKTYPPGSMIMGAPAKAVRQLSEDEHLMLQESAKHYVETASAYLQRQP